MLVIMTFQKSRFACVSDRRILSKRRATTSFALEDRYNHDRPYKHTFHVMKSHRNFFEGPEVTIGTLWSSLFEVTGKGRVSIWVWFSQNRYGLTFVIIKSYLSVARPFCLFWKIYMIFRKLANTNIMSWEATEKFLEDPEVIIFIWENTLFEIMRKGRTSLWLQKESFLKWRQRLQDPPKCFL